MANILSLDTATNVCSVALHESGRLLAAESLTIDRSHSRYLTPCIAHLLEITGLEKSDLNAVAVSKGPGSYTGLRIGTSAAKGLCYALDIPLIAVNTLEAMAHTVIPFVSRGTILCPMLDARRMEVYCMLIDPSGQVHMETEAMIIEEGAFSDVLAKHSVYFFGSGAAKCKTVLGKSSQAVFIDGVEADARSVGRLAWKRHEQGRFEDLAYFEPFYLKDFMTRKPRSKFSDREQK